MTGSLYYLGNSRSPAQTADMVALEAEGVCILCPPYILERKTVLHQTQWWFVTTNDFPYRHGKDGPPAQLHLLLSPKSHVEDLLDLESRALDDFWDAMFWVRSEYELAHYAIGSRNGVAEYTGATIRHVHVHVAVGDPHATEPLRLKISSRPTETPPS